MSKQWHLMEHCIPAQLICHPQLNILTWYFRTPPMGNGCVKHGAMNSIYWQIIQYMRAWALLFPLQTDLIIQLHDIVATLAQDISIESPHKQRFCSSYNEVQTFEWSSAVAQSTEFIQFAVSNYLRILVGLNTSHGRGNIAEILPGWPTVRGILSWAVKMDELHAVDHIYIHNFAVFSVRLYSQRYETLEVQHCTDPTAPLDL